MAFREHRDGAQYLLVAEGFEAAARTLGLLQPGALAQLLARGDGARGRTDTALVELPGHAERLHLRPIRHGGLLGGCFGDRLLGRGRPIAELHATQKLALAGAPVPRPVLVAAQRRAGPVWSAAIGTIHVEGARDGLLFLNGHPSRAALLRAAAAAGYAVRQFHDAGGHHADLHAGNLLFREENAETQSWVIDLDRARVATPVDPARRMRELMRLFRSLLKRGFAKTVGPRGYATFFAAYTQHDRDLRRALLTHLRRERRRTALHALAYR